jgi:hypothetical protein
MIPRQPPSLMTIGRVFPIAPRYHKKRPRRESNPQPKFLENSALPLSYEGPELFQFLNNVFPLLRDFL